MDLTFLFFSCFIGYGIGSIPFGLLFGLLGGQGDVRDIGSGNIGATNVLRTGRKDLAFFTLAMDVLKAVAAVKVIDLLVGEPYCLFAGAFALLGHCYPIWLSFKGGKGVATFFGALLAVKWPIGLIAAGVWLAVAFISKMSSLAALTAALAAPIIAYFLGHTNIAIMAAFMALIIFIRHRENIRRILSGEESKIGQKSDGPA